MGLSTNHSLINLNLDSCELGDEGVGVICEVLSTQKTADDQGDKIFELMNSVSLEIQDKNTEKQILILNSNN